MIELSAIKAAYDSNPLGILLLEASSDAAEAAQILWANAAAGKALGQDPSGLSGAPLRRFFHIDPQWDRALRRAAREGEADALTWTAQEGAAGAAELFPLERGLCGCVLSPDPAEPSGADGACLDLLPVGVYRRPAAGPAADRFDFVSRGLRAMAGYDAEGFQRAFAGRFSQFICAADRERVLEETERNLSDGGASRCEYRLTAAGGVQKWVQSTERLVTDHLGRAWLYGVVVNIDRHKHAQRNLQTLQLILDELPWIAVFDYDPAADAIVFFLKTQGLETREITMANYLGGANPSRLPPESAAALRGAIRAVLGGPDSGSVDFQANFQGTELRWCRASFASYPGEDGQVARVVGRITDVHEEVQRERELRDMARRDTMTGFLNHDASQRAIGESILRDGGGTLLIMDIDDFKQVNDTLGHLFGDSFLQRAAEALRHLFRQGDILGRFGGDEFLAFLPGVHSAALARRRSQDIIDAIAGIKVESLASIQCSVGAAMTDRSDMPMEELFLQADRALYEAKRRGKGRYRLYQDAEAAPDRMPESVPRRPAPAPLSPKASSLVGDVLAILGQAELSEAGIHDALAHVGRWLDVSRMYIFENGPGQTYCDNTFEWCDDGVPSRIDQRQQLPLEEYGVVYYDNFNVDDIYYCADTRRLLPWQRSFQESMGVKALLQWAFRDDGALRGFIGFDECREDRMWVQEQIDALVRTAQIISLFLLRLRDKERARRQ